MTYRKKSVNNKMMLEEELLSEIDDYLPSILDMINGYCKVNLVVPQTSTFCSSQSLLPINAKADSTLLNNKMQKIPINNSPDMLKNVNFNTDDNVDDKSLFDKKSVNEFHEYSKPSYSENTNNLIKKEETTNNKISPKNRKKKNKYSKIETASTSSTDNQTPVLSDRSDQNFSNDYYNQFKNGRSNVGLYNKQDQERKQLRIMKNNNNSPLRNQPSSLPNSENEIQNDNLSPQSECPLCFGLYPTLDIEVHASECSI